MKQYVLDELRPEDHEKIKAFLEARYAVSGFADLYWVPVAEALLNETQRAHHECGPFYMALELFADRLVCELLVRARQRIHCLCIQYADEAQRNWLIKLIDDMFEKLEIRI